VELGLAEIEAETARQTQLRHTLWTRLQPCGGVHLNGHPSQRLPGNLNVSFEGVDGEALLLGLRSIVAVASGAACSSTSMAPSHVLKALGRSDELAYASLRFGMGRYHTAAEIEQVATGVVNTINTLRQVTTHR
jgi:cysteine desulfurase